MTENNRILNQKSRRSFLKGALASGAAVGLAGCSQIRGEEEGNVGNETEGDTPTETDVTDEQSAGKALMFQSEFNGGAQFRVVSGVLDQHPSVEGVQEGDIWSEYNTRMIEYLNTEENITFFPTQDAEVQLDQVYELHDNFTWFNDNVNDEGIIDVKFSRVGDDQMFDTNNWEVVEQGGGKALIRLANYRPGAVFTITSNVVEWTPREDVKNSGIFSEYNTHFAEWLNTGNDFQIYVAHEAEIEQGAHYRLTDEFDLTDPEGNLVTVDVERVQRGGGG